MPQLFSATPSPLVSPRMGSPPMMAPVANMKPSPSSPVTYIPPLCDGACGTVPRSQQPLWAIFRQEVAQTVQMVPTLCWAMLNRRSHLSWTGMADMVVHTILACTEMCMMVAAVPLWLTLPGAMSAIWTCFCAAVVMAMCWTLNGTEQTHQCAAMSEGWMMGQEGEDEKWLFLGGMGMSSRHCHRTTLPMLSKLFSRPVTCVCVPTLGLPFDMTMMMLQRCMPLQSRARRNLYSQIRCALLDDSMRRCVVLCHNHSSIIVSQAVAQLCADIPSEKLHKLEIYTFGAAAYEFVMPLGETGPDTDQPHSHDMVPERPGIHVEHFAMANDPFAQMGILKSVRKNMDGRFCGGVFIINSTANSSSSSKAGRMVPPPTSGVMMEDYLLSLFPAQLATPPTNGSPPHRSVLDSVMLIDRDCAEKREITAMSNYYTASRARKDSGSKRLSWTGLATQAGGGGGGYSHKNGVSAGMVGLEMARKGCKNCDGHKGREVSWLVRYVPIRQVGEIKQSEAGMGRG